MPTVQSADGVSLEVSEAGDPQAPALVFVHGYPDAKEVWLDVLDRLQADFHVIAYDVRGTGGSDAPRGAAAYDLERLGDDLLAVLDGFAPGRAAHLVGHDWGGIQGWEFATSQRFRDRLASFTAIAAPSLDQVALSGQALLRGGRVIEWGRRAYRSWYILALLTPGVPKTAGRLLASGGRWQRLLERRDGVPPYPHPTLARDARNGANLYRRNIPRRSTRPRRDAITHVPVQVIIPAEDRFISQAYYERAEQHAPDLRRHVVSGGHWLPRTEPELVARLVREFVDEVEAQGEKRA